MSSTSIEPPPDYWASLAGLAPREAIETLRQLSEARLKEFTSRSADVALLEQMANDGWLRRERRLSCPNCEVTLTDAEAAQPTCPNCHEDFALHGGVVEEMIYVRSLAAVRVVDWVVAIHGMNTSGAWQEAFSWQVGTTWGRSVPVAVYKYGIVIPGVMMPWRRTALRNELRTKLVALRDEASSRGFSGKPDVIAHSFGTWLLGHLMEEEVKRAPAERLSFGRIILAGCVLRPDFNWKRLKTEGMVEEVLNHYGTRDRVVPLAHATIHDSGPSGRRGFDGEDVLNIRAEGYGHSDLFLRDLNRSYSKYWRPFLKLPRKELNAIPDRADPTTIWKPLPWPLRGTLFPLFALPLMIALLALLVTGIGAVFAWIAAVLWSVACWSATALALLLAATAIASMSSGNAP